MVMMVMMIVLIQGDSDSSCPLTGREKESAVKALFGRRFPKAILSSLVVFKTKSSLKRAITDTSRSNVQQKSKKKNLNKV